MCVFLKVCIALLLIFYREVEDSVANFEVICINELMVKMLMLYVGVIAYVLYCVDRYQKGIYKIVHHSVKSYKCSIVT